MTAGPIRALGMAWYREEDYDELRRLMSDKRVLPNTFRKWLYLAEKGEKQFSGQGVIVERVYLDPREFPAWCAARGLDLDAQARTQFASEAVARKYRNQS